MLFSNKIPGFTSAHAERRRHTGPEIVIRDMFWELERALGVTTVVLSIADVVNGCEKYEKLVGE